MSDRIKEHILNFIFLAFGGAGTAVSGVAALIKYAELRACLKNASTRYPLEIYPELLTDFVFSIIILALFSVVFTLPWIRRKPKRLESVVLFFVGATGIVCFAKILISVVGTIEYNFAAEPHLNIIRTYWIAILGSTIPFLFFAALFVRALFVGLPVVCRRFQKRDSKFAEYVLEKAAEYKKRSGK